MYDSCVLRCLSIASCFQALDHLESFIADCDRRTEAAKRKLKETQEELSEEAKQKADEIHKLGEEIGTKLAKAEQMGAEGHVSVF